MVPSSEWLEMGPILSVSSDGKRHPEPLSIIIIFPQPFPSNDFLSYIGESGLLNHSLDGQSRLKSDLYGPKLVVDQC